MPKAIFLSVILTTFSWSSAFSQPSSEDSLLAIVRENKNDLSKFQALVQLGKRNEAADIQKSIRYFKAAASLPFHLEYATEFIETYNALGNLYHLTGRYDSSFTMHGKAIAMAKKFDHEKEVGLGYQGIGLNFMRLSQRDSATLFFNRALSIFGKLNDPKLEAGVYLNLGNVSLDQANYTEALNQFIHAERIYSSNGQDKAGLSKALGNIGNIESILGNFERALDYTDRSIRLSLEINNNLNIAYGYRLKGRIYRKQKEYKRSLEEYKRALAIYELRNDNRNVSETYQSIGNIYYDLKEYKNALVEYERSLRIARVIANPTSMAFAFSGIGYANYELKRNAHAIEYFDSSIIMARAAKNRYLVMDAYEVISNIHQEQAHFKEALSFHQLFSQLKDSLTEEENRESTKEIEAKYQSEKKQAQIDLLQKEQQLKTSSLQQSKIIQYFLIGAFVLVVGFGFLILNRNRLINQTKRQLEIERMRSSLARDLHDDIGSALSSITIMSQLAGTSSVYAKRIMEQSSKIQESMADIVWSINPMNDSLEKMVFKMKEFAAEILEPKNIAYHFNESELTEQSINIEKRKNIFLIFKEALNNAAKYSGAASVEITLALSQGTLHLSIADDGQGFDLAHHKNGNGLNNMTARAEAIGGKFTVNSSLGGGTKIELKVEL